MNAMPHPNGSSPAAVSPLESVLAPCLSPDEHHKAAMLRHIEARTRLETASPANRVIWRLRGWASDCPWRLAFLMSTLQTAVCTAVFGDAYLRLVLQLFLPLSGVGR